jgi:hypothetical protein
VHEDVGAKWEKELCPIMSFIASPLLPYKFEIRVQAIEEIHNKPDSHDNWHKKFE